MRDTPMVDAMMKFCFGTDDEFVRIKDAAKLERELNAANDRIQSLIEERDRANRLAEWKWNLRDEFESLLGTDKIEEGIEAVKELKRRIKRLEEAAMKALHGCYNGPMPDHVRDALADAMEAKP